MKTWFITGASRGFGEEITKAALAAGDAVVAAARTPGDVTARIGEHPRLMPVALDVNDEAQVNAAVDAAIERFGGIDVLVNNAGFGLVGAVEEVSDAEARAVFDTNVFGLLRVTRAVLPHLRARRRGHVINLSSVGGFSGAPGYGIYCATKFAVEGLSEALAGEVAPLGIHVTVVEPGYFRTDFLSAASVRIAGAAIADYAGTTGKQRARERDGLQPGDPALGARAIVTMAQAAQPPLRLPLGADAFAANQHKLAQVTAEMAAWQALGEATAFAPDASEPS